DAFAYPDGAQAAREVLARERPTHLVSIERPGRGRGGDYLNMRGVSVARWNRPADELFLRPRRRADRTGVSEPRASQTRPPLVRAAHAPLATIAVGDGGNEIVMGNVRGALTRQGTLMARIASVVRVDHLVVAGV